MKKLKLLLTLSLEVNNLSKKTLFDSVIKVLSQIKNKEIKHFVDYIHIYNLSLERGNTR